jgi:glyoxalase family protein
MQLEGIHHITAITGDAPQNVDFYVGALGLRMVKKTVNQDDPTVYHLFYGDDDGSPGMDLTFFEYPGAAPGQAAAGMVHLIGWRVGSPQALDFWQARLSDRGMDVQRDEHTLRFTDPEGLAHELRVSDADQPLRAEAPDIPAEHALAGFDGVRAYAAQPSDSDTLLGDTLGFQRTAEPGAWEVRGAQRGGLYVYDAAPGDVRPVQGAGTVHHVAFASQPQEHDAWHERVAQSGARPTEVIDRFYFRSIYFREPSGVLFELATIGPGFAVDEDAAHLGERLSLPPRFEPLRARLESTLTPLPAR